ncbi:MAG: hypothetical protein WCJ28_07180 [Actinomycetota bacterium]
MLKPPRDAHEWIAFEDHRDARTWMFDVTFLESNWTCIYGSGCEGVLTGPAEELVQGCCSYGAHFVDADDVKVVKKAAKTLTPEQWQFYDKGQKGFTTKTKDGTVTTKLVDDACIFLNRPGFEGGPGCALHRASIETGKSYVKMKPEVCWQLPLRRDDEVEDDGHVVTRIGQWNRRHWGEGGEEFHWWCTESDKAFVGVNAVWESMGEELEAMAGKETHRQLVRYLEDRVQRTANSTPLPHPVIRRREKS